MTDGGGSALDRLRAIRARIADRPWLNRIYRVGVGVVGTVVLVVGVLAIPYPGPGWAIVFTGFGILATEFSWARSALGWVRQRYDRFMAWYRAQGLAVRWSAVLLTTAVVLVTLWLLGVFALVGGWFHVDWSWLRSPLS